MITEQQLHNLEASGKIQGWRQTGGKAPVSTEPALPAPKKAKLPTLSIGDIKAANKAFMPAARFIVGIDPGTNTGLAIWSRDQQKLERVDCLPIHQAMDAVRHLKTLGLPMFIRVEDARQRRWFGKMDGEQGKYGAGVREGAGAAKRDAAIWDAFLSDLGVLYAMVKPLAGMTKKTAADFKRLTGWDKKTNEHGRDAAGLCYGF